MSDAAAFTGPPSWRDFVSSDPRICHGKPCVTGTRVMITVVLDNLAAGMSPSEIEAEYPGVSPDAAHACLAYAAEALREATVLVPA